MADIYGVQLEHTTPFDGTHENRWWVAAESLEDALDKGNTIANSLQQIFGDDCRFQNIHVWLPNSTPNQFRNRAISILGSFEATNPTSAIPVLRMYMTPSGTSYPNYKDFRICLNVTEQTGRNWGSAVAAAAGDVALLLSGLSYIVARNGDTITDYAFEPQVKFRQLSKRWYNRET